MPTAWNAMNILQKAWTAGHEQSKYIAPCISVCGVWHVIICVGKDLLNLLKYSSLNFNSLVYFCNEAEPLNAVPYSFLFVCFFFFYKPLMSTNNINYLVIYKLLHLHRQLISISTVLNSISCWTLHYLPWQEAPSWGPCLALPPFLFRPDAA